MSARLRAAFISNFIFQSSRQRVRMSNVLFQRGQRRVAFKSWRLDMCARRLSIVDRYSITRSIRMTYAAAIFGLNFDLCGSIGRDKASAKN